MCQKDSYLKEFKTVVKSSTPSQLKVVTNGKKEVVKGYEVILEDTVLFPEGGGQPDDHGTLNGCEVLRITRKGANAIHFVKEDFSAGEEVNQVVDWQRRWDHMQQHSGQHLVTAIADEMFGFKTTSWALGEKTSFIELDTTNMSQDQMCSLERVVNEKIQACIPMYPQLFSGLDDPNLTEFRTRGLPDDHVGPIRVVTIEGIERDLCCGTHVSNLAHLQVIKLIGTEKGKKGKVNLVFIVGQRVLNYLSQSLQKEKSLTALLKGGPDQHVELLEKLCKTVKETKKNELTLLRDLAKMEAAVFLSKQPRPEVLAVHRKEGDMDFQLALLNEVNDPTICIFVTCGDEKGSGMFLLSAPPDILSEVSNKVLQLLEGKGANKNNRLQGRANKLSKRKEVLELLTNTVKNNSDPK